ncbi:hypothetical protein Silverhawkium_gp124 [Shigella phage Silverhawkium]|uniref:Uncharacterized protein n=1 Tax=Shigella phage Silverhawkium TaxID=2530185 RepID=A0A482JMD5_9CAUD|nr:hypothetical protein Silverhawkium_gp124 [Shigella phage Silverhawkium]
MKRVRTRSTKQKTGQELFFNPLQIFLLTFGRKGSKRGWWGWLPIALYLHKLKINFLARPWRGLHVLKMKKLFGVDLHNSKMNFPFGDCGDVSTDLCVAFYLHVLEIKKPSLPHFLKW